MNKLLSPLPEYRLCLPDSPDRGEVEAFTRKRFQDTYAATIKEFYPVILAMRCFDNLSGTSGMRIAGQEALFLEHYLDRPVEHLLSEKLQTTVKRQSIAEIGNLVSTQRGASHLLFLLFTSLLHQAGQEWICFTATQALRNNLSKLGFEFIYLGEAEPDKLDAQSIKDWGSYYANKPQVLAGKLQDAMAVIQSRPLFRRVYRLYRHRINYLAREFQATPHA